VGQVVRLRKFKPPLPRFVSKRNSPIKLEYDGLKLTLELPEDCTKIRPGISRMMVELIGIHDNETRNPDQTPEERRRFFRALKARLRTGALPDGLVQAIAANPQAPAPDFEQASWYLWMPPAQRPDTAA